jgi:hypothetical protein
MSILSWARWLFAWPATRSIRKAPARCCATIEALEDRAQPTSPFKPAGGKAKPHRNFSAPREQAPGSLV